jgi:hypothetical protein
VKLDDWEMRVAFAKEDWPQVIAIMESTFGISLAGRPTRINRGFSQYPEIWICMPPGGAEYGWSGRSGFAQAPLGIPIGEDIQIFTVK